MITEAGCTGCLPLEDKFDVAEGGLVPEISEVDSDQILAELLDFLRSERGFDFTEYKVSTVRRRIARRMTTLGIESIHSYRDYLESEPAEFPLLLDLLLINVTDFFRDQEAWDALSALLTDEVRQAVEDNRQFRVWCPGCATGEEAYTIAIVLAELMGEESFRSLVRIFATDIDENALVQARSGNYTARAMESVHPHLREKYFVQQGGSYVFRSDLRMALTFGRHDIISDPPISRLDLLSFRNTLIYFNSDLQRRILGRFRTALQPGGLLFLGRSESLVLQQDYFTPLDVRHRIFEPVPRQVMAEPTPSVTPSITSPIGREGSGPIGVVGVGAAQAGPFAQFIFDLDGTLIGANASARAQFSITERDLGATLDSLLMSRLSFSLTPIVESVHATLTPQTYCAVERTLAGDQMQYLDVVVSPLIDEFGAPIGTSVVAIDTTELVRLRLERDLALEDTQALSEELKSSIQDLQSTNEELETSNEELQSMNEELETTNDDLSAALLEVKSLNEHIVGSERGNRIDLDRFLNQLPIGVVLLTDTVVRSANERAEECLGNGEQSLEGTSREALNSRWRRRSGVRDEGHSDVGDWRTVPISISTQADHESRYLLLEVEATGDREGLLLLLPDGELS